MSYLIRVVTVDVPCRGFVARATWLESMYGTRLGMLLRYEMRTGGCSRNTVRGSRQSLHSENGGARWHSTTFCGCWQVIHCRERCVATASRVCVSWSPETIKARVHVSSRLSVYCSVPTTVQVRFLRKKTSVRVSNFTHCSASSTVI